MTAPQTGTRRRRKAVEVTSEQYAAFIQQLSLESIWLADAQVQNNVGPDLPGEASLVFEPLEAEFEIIETGFEATHEYGLQIHDDSSVIAEITATFSVRFRSEQVMTAELFESFKEVNLPVNTWPFFREFVHTTLGRFGWVPFTLPAFKVGTPHAAHQARREAGRRPKRPISSEG